MAEVERLWGAARQPAVDLAQDLHLSSTVLERTRSQHVWRRWARVSAWAASVLLAAGLLWFQQGGLDRLRSDAHTAVGQIQRVSLDDGSVITLNTDTALSFHLDAHQRDVKLLRGEAYFQVAHDATRPFVVESPAGSARVLGTAFNVRIDREQTRVSVVEGRVAVSSAGRNEVLVRGQSAWLRADGVKAEANRDAIAVKAWQRGQVVFYRTPLADVAAEIGRYRHGLVMVRGEALRRMPVSGAFDVTDPDDALKLVRDTLGIKSIVIGGWITVLY